MKTRLRLLAMLALFALVIAACGGGTDADNGTDGDTGGGDDPTSQDGSTGDGDGDGDSDGSGDTGSQDTGSDGGGASGPPDLDPGDMPPAGEVAFSVDGQTFTIVAADMDYFTCELTGDFINVRSESETLSLTVQFDPAIERGNASLVSEDDGVQYNSFFGGETAGGVAIEPPHLVYEAEFDATQLDDLALSDAGFGRVEVTCP